MPKCELSAAQSCPTRQTNFAFEWPPPTLSNDRRHFLLFLFIPLMTLSVPLFIHFKSLSLFLPISLSLFIVKVSLCFSFVQFSLILCFYFFLFLTLSLSLSLSLSLFKSGPFPVSFLLYFRLFTTVSSEKLAHAWIRTVSLWCRKQPLN